MSVLLHTTARLSSSIVIQTLSYCHLNRITLPDVYSIFESTCGIVFLGTPHRGSDKAVLADTITSILRLVIRSNNQAILEPLKRDSQVLARISESFNVGLVEKTDIIIYTFHESLETPGFGIVSLGLSFLSIKSNMFS